MTKSESLQIAAAISPAPLLAILAILPWTREWTTYLVRENWGNIASVWGLAVSIWTLAVAKGARKAAQEAVQAERLRTALGGLDEASTKCTDLGQFARGERWDLVELKADEILRRCRTTVAAWGNDTALKDSKNKLNQVATQMNTIIEQTRNTPVDRHAILVAQLKAVENLAVVVGRIQKDHKLRS